MLTPEDKAKILEVLKQYLTNVSLHLSEQAPLSSAKYVGIATRLKRDGHLYGCHDSWATDAFASCFRYTRLQLDMYDEAYEYIFGKREPSITI